MLSLVGSVTICGNCLVPHHELDVAERRLASLEELHHPRFKFAVGLLERLLDDAEHHAEANARDGDAGEARLARGFETRFHHLTQGRLQVVDHEHDVLERSTVLAVARRHDRHEVAQFVLRCLGVEVVTCDTLDCSIDATEPHLARVDRCDEGVRGFVANVALNHLDAGVSDRLVWLHG